MSALWMIAASFLFACMGVCVKLAGAYFSAGELVFYRSLIATALVAVFIVRRRLPLATGHAGMHGRRSLAGFVALAAYFSAITLIPLATAVTLSYTSPLFLALLVALRMPDGQAGRVLPALVAGFVGIVLILQPTFDQRQWLGGLLGLAAGAISSLAYFNVRRLGELGEPEWRTVFYFSLFSAIAAAPWALFSHDGRPVPSSGWLLIAGVGGFGAAAQWCMTTAYARGRTLAVASLAYSTVVFASLFGILIWHEILPAMAWGGMVLIVAAGLVATVRAAPRRSLVAEL